MVRWISFFEPDFKAWILPRRHSLIPVLPRCRVVVCVQGKDDDDRPHELTRRTLGTLLGWAAIKTPGAIQVLYEGDVRVGELRSRPRSLGSLGLYAEYEYDDMERLSLYAARWLRRFSLHRSFGTWYDMSSLKSLKRLDYLRLSFGHLDDAGGDQSASLEDYLAPGLRFLDLETGDGEVFFGVKSLPSLEWLRLRLHHPGEDIPFTEDWLLTLRDALAFRRYRSLRRLDILLCVWIPRANPFRDAKEIALVEEVGALAVECGITFKWARDNQQDTWTPAEWRYWRVTPLDEGLCICPPGTMMA